MKKTYKGILSFLVSIVLITSCFSNVSAAKLTQNRRTPTHATAENSDKILIDFGIDEEQVLDMDELEKIELAKIILINPERVSYSKTTNQIDEISAIEKIVNMSDVELLELGMTKENLSTYRKDIEHLRSLTNEQLKEEYNATDESIKILKMALTENEQFYQKPLSGNIVTTSGDITTTEMDFSLTVSDNRSSTCKPVSYRIITYFNWKYHYITHSTDEVAVGWGGSCNSTNLSRTLYYGHNNQSKKIYSGSSSNDVYDDTGRIISRSTETINQGILTSIECGANANYTDYYNCLKKGYIYTTIYKNNKDNFSTKVLARYGHLVPHIGFSASMSFGGAPGISIGLGYGYDYTYQASWDITT